MFKEVVITINTKQQTNILLICLNLILSELNFIYKRLISKNKSIFKLTIKLPITREIGNKQNKKLINFFDGLIFL